ncbi:2OG-Fe(II) oxygenase superfamily protein [Lepidopterella palustris CBS 459.81]|uniref:2OG-Fe(II) oxygenase superfamily protein n=1 Tax=Lepidopterella palustris CBS 459.81 TaxID=1314670 RepID=A0A8E2JFS1_9PEZI|nr:2OG-Fe(II) oxygenase superfamily protein [Lepidopterella palustris CBS 459.81]
MKSPIVFRAAFGLLVASLLGILNLAESASASEEACPHHLYQVQLFSQDPLVVYIPDFITAEEAEHLEYITRDKFTRSEVADQYGNLMNATTRTSRSTSVASDPVVRCIESRALAFQGYDTPRSHLEPLQLVQYNVGEKYHAHTDWFEATSQTTAEFGGNRHSSFFVYVAADEITGGGTNFPLLDAPKDERWCKFVNCDEPWDAGVTFRPIPRNAVFWQNLHKDGRGNRATLHAGLPLTSGSKLGMNIWTREKPLSPQYRSDGLN